MNPIYRFLAVFLVLCIFGCGEQDNGSSSETPDETPPAQTTAVSAIQLTTSSSSIGTNQSATITATLFDESGQVVEEPKAIIFKLSNPSLGSIPSPITTSSGFTSQTFTARDVEGSLTISALVDEASAQQTIQISDAVSASAVNVTANPEIVTVNGTSVVSATILDSSGNTMPDGTTVNFALNNDSLGTIVQTATTADGIAQATFSANETNTGTVTVTATSGSASGTTLVEVRGSAAGSIEFLSATPQVVVIQGAGGQETSIVEFLVKDSNGNPVTGSQTVHLELSGPNGGEYIGPNEGIKTLDVGTVEGIAKTTLHSGTIPGTATITATVDGTELVTSSGVIAIGGGVPSEGHFSLSAEQLNLEGFAYDNITTMVQALIADRYGNYNVLEGTSVSFYSECGAIDRAVALDAEGSGSVTFRTQRPDPIDLDADPLGTPAGAGSCGQECDEENAYIEYYHSIFGVDISSLSTNPRDGLCTIVTVVDGEEEFTDANASGTYNLGESFDDTYDDIHLDKDDDSAEVPFGNEVPGIPYDAAFEDLIVDRNEDESFDGMNDVWDNSKRITRRINLLMTGIPGLSVSAYSLNVADGGSQTIYFSIHDLNFNQPIAGTTFTVTLDGSGVLTGVVENEYLDTNDIGAPIYSVTVSDDNPGDTDPAEVGTLKFTWEWKGGTYSDSLPVTVD